MKAVLVIGIISGAAFIWFALNEIEYRRKWGRRP